MDRGEIYESTRSKYILHESQILPHTIPPAHYQNNKHWQIWLPTVACTAVMFSGDTFEKSFQANIGQLQFNNRCQPPLLNLPWCNIKSTAHSTSPSKPFSTVLLCVIPWFQYERIIVLLHVFAKRALRLFPEKRTKHWSLVTSWQHSSQYPK